MVSFRDLINLQNGCIFIIIGCIVAIAIILGVCFSTETFFSLDIDECSTHQTECDLLKTCVNTDGSYNCACTHGTQTQKTGCLTECKEDEHHYLPSSYDGTMSKTRWGRDCQRWSDQYPHQYVEIF